MKLNDPLDTTFEFNGKEYPLNLAFNSVLDMFELWNEKDIEPAHKIAISLEILLNEPFMDNVHDVEQLECMLLMWEELCERYFQEEANSGVTRDLKGNIMPKQKKDSNIKAIDFAQDAELIFAAFKQSYGINLYEEQGKMSWGEFKALLNGVPKNTRLAEVIQIRLWKPQKGESSEYKKAMRNLQKHYALGQVVDDE